MLRWFESTSSHQRDPQLRLRVFFVLELVGFEQVGRPKAASNSPADCCLDRGLANPPAPAKVLNVKTYFYRLGQHRTIPALRLKHRFGGCGTASALPKCSIMSGCGTRIVLRGQKPLALCDRCPCFGSLFPPLAALTFAASSIICAFGLASAAPRSPYRHLELCGITL